jgi:hypothetical protein
MEKEEIIRRLNEELAGDSYEIVALGGEPTSARRDLLGDPPL